MANFKGKLQPRILVWDVKKFRFIILQLLGLQPRIETFCYISMKTSMCYLVWTFSVASSSCQKNFLPPTLPNINFVLYGIPIRFNQLISSSYIIVIKSQDFKNLNILPEEMKMTILINTEIQVQFVLF